MSTVRELLTPAPPPILYHYTTPRGLIGIVNNREIWASHTQYLNDQREFHHAVGIIQDEIAAMKKEPGYRKHKKLLDEMAMVLADSGAINVCVCSFSEDGDVLSQWRAYSGDAGFSIGFSGEFLRSIAEDKRFWLVKCIYDEAQQRVWMRALIADVLSENIQRQLDEGSEDNEDPIPGGNLGAYLNRYAPILKHRSFAEEREWRIISRPLPSTRDGFDFRAGRSMLIPYYKIPLQTAAHPFNLAELVVGPTPHPIQSSRSVQTLMAKHRLTPTLRNMAAPFRNW